jgi:hypothetical protein
LRENPGDVKGTELSQYVSWYRDHVEEMRRTDEDLPRKHLRMGLERGWNLIDTFERDCLPDQVLIEYGEKVRPMYVEMLSRLDSRLDVLRERLGVGG